MSARWHIGFILKGLDEYIEKEGKETMTLKTRPSKTRTKKYVGQITMATIS